MNIEKLAPSPKLCKQLPEGAFCDSALVWQASTTAIELEWIVVPREQSEPLMWRLPAPTLAEILEALQNLGAAMIQCSWSNMLDWWECSCCNTTSPQQLVAKHHLDNPATAALRLWLEVTEKEKEKDD